MKNIYSILILLLMSRFEIFPQGLFNVTTDKINYSYGEMIEVEVSILNNTDSMIVLPAECVYPVWVSVKDVEFLEMHSLADGCERNLAVGEKETWTYQLDPAKLGFPTFSGEQVIYGSGYTCVDSVKITAPKYYGGIIEVKFDYILEKEKRDNFFNSINATVIKTDSIKDLQQLDELWSIQNTSIDSIVNEQNRSTERFGYVNTYRLFEQGNMIITSIEDETSTPNCYLLMNNYPNPFNPVTTITYELPTQSKVIIRICDLLGREITTLVNDEKPVGKHSILFDGNNLSSGVYFYQLIADGKVLTKKLVLMK